MPNTRNLLFETIEKRVNAYTSHPYLRACQVSQSVSRFHFEVTYAILTAANVNDETLEEVLKAILLLEQGLSVHDTVDKNAGMLRQLTVLTGDFSSSQYYSVLARMGNFRLLYRLSMAITRINSAKMKLDQMKD